MSQVRLRKKYRSLKDGKRVLQTYRVEFYDPSKNPKCKRISLETKNAQVAMRKCVRLELDFDNGKYDPWSDRMPKAVTLANEAIERFLEERSHLRARTLENYRYILGALVRALPNGLPVDQIADGHIDEYFDGLSLKPESRASYLTHLRAFFNWCLGERLIRESPLGGSRFKKKRMKARVAQYLPKEEFERLLGTIKYDGESNPHVRHDNRWLTDAIIVDTYTGLRLGELVHLSWRDVDMENRLIHVRNSDSFETKTGDERSVPLPDRAFRVIERLAARDHAPDDPVLLSSSGERIFGPYLSGRFRHYRRMAGLPEHVHFHSLRHTYGSWFVQRGGNLSTLGDLMGHKDFTTTRGYARGSDSAARRIVDRIFGDAEPVGNGSLIPLMEVVLDDK